MTKEKFIKEWGSKNDSQRIQWLMRIRGEGPTYEINIDNDDVFVSFPSENEDGQTTLHFDEYGYYLLYEIFKALELPADFV